MGLRQTPNPMQKNRERQDAGTGEHERTGAAGCGYTVGPPGPPELALQEGPSSVASGAHPAATLTSDLGPQNWGWRVSCLWSVVMPWAAAQAHWTRLGRESECWGPGSATRIARRGDMFPGKVRTCRSRRPGGGSWELGTGGRCLPRGQRTWPEVDCMWLHRALSSREPTNLPS